MAVPHSEIEKRVSQLTALMTQRGLSHYIVPSEDAHQSLAVVHSRGHGKLWTDGRYYTQAERELDSTYWKLMKSEGPSPSQWLADNATNGSVVGVDPKLLSVSDARSMQKLLSSQGITLDFVLDNLVDLVWGESKPKAKTAPILTLADEAVGASVASKLTLLWKEMKENKADIFVLSALDEICWLLNIRGTGDIDYNPVVISYAIVTLDKGVDLYLDLAKVSADASAVLAKAAVTVKPYEDFFKDLAAHNASNKKAWMDTSKANWAMFTTFAAERVVEKASPIQFMKAVKNDTELQGMRDCHIRDGAAQAEFFSWLEKELENGNTGLTEKSVTKIQEEFRAKQKHFRGLSFGTISSVGENAAVIHYSPPETGSATIVKEKIYLNDSGAQYTDGTTDITRTFHFGTPTSEEKSAYTRVLKGFIALSRAVFPKGANGYIIDVLARQFLWQVGLDYNHGTGHGVGHFLNVHEWPVRIGCTERGRDRAMHPVSPRMVTSNEPGFYKPGSFGIRIENLMACKVAKTPNNFDGVEFYGFEQLTQVPIQTKMIDLALMEKGEIEYLNQYHKEVFDKVSPLISSNPVALAWLKKETAAIGV